MLLVIIQDVSFYRELTVNEISSTHLHVIIIIHCNNNNNNSLLDNDYKDARL